MFTESDARQLRSFIYEDWGQHLLEELQSSRPSLEGSTMEETFGNAKRAEGWEMCIAHITSLASRPEEKETPESFLDFSGVDPR